MRPLTFRARILLLILAVGLVPLGLLGLWITRTVPKSGERLLQTRLEDGLQAVVGHLSSRWVAQRSEILFLADAAANHEEVLRGEAATDGDPPADVAAIFLGLGPAVRAVSVMAADGLEVWQLDRSSLSGTGLSGTGLSGIPTAPAGVGPALASEVVVYERLSGDRLGTLGVEVELDAILAPGEVGPETAGLVVAAFDRESGVSLLPLALDPSLLRDDSFRWAGDRWMASRHTLDEPALEVVVAAPLGPIMAPLEETARRSTWMLLLVAGTALLLAAYVTGRMTRSLESLSEAASAVSKGDLEQRVAATGDDEVGRLGRAFNRMTESLRKMLAELASRESLAAVGEFAASLAHEVRNPLTAIRIDLQLVEEGLTEDSKLRVPQRRALREVTRLDETVSRALSVARSGRIRKRPIDLREPVDAAGESAIPTFQARGATLQISLPDSPALVSGDPAALEQLFLNLLRNAGESLDTGGVAEVSLFEENEDVVVLVRDDGPGIPEEALDRIFEPFFSTRPEGTGLGLPIARRIATAHAAELVLDSALDVGTTATVRFPMLDSEDGV